MKKNFKKAILMTLAASVIFGACGCSKKSDNGDIVTIKWYAYGTPNRDDQKVFDKVNEYTREKIGAEINYISIAQAEYNEKMKMLFASNEKFDMCFQASGTDFYTNVENGVLLPLNDLLDGVGKTTKDLTPDYFFDAATVDGKIYAIPMNKDVAQKWAFNLNAEMSERNGITQEMVDNVKELKDLEPFFKTIKENEPDIYPCLIRGNNHFFRFLPFDTVNGCSVGAFRTSDFN